MFPHHAFSAEFDEKKTIKRTGVVTKLEWQNPHTWFYIDVKDDSGRVTNWGLEMGSPNLLIRAGWSRNSMKIGDLVTVEGFYAKDGSNMKPLTYTQKATLIPDEDLLEYFCSDNERDVQHFK